MSWRAVTEADVLGAIQGPESRAAREKLLAAGQTDPLPGIMAQVTLEFRDAIRSCEKNTLDEDASFLPEGAIFHAVAIIRYRLLTRLAVGDQEQPGDARTAEYRAALDYLKAVAKCDRYVEPAGGTGTEVKPEAAGPRISANTRRFTRGTQDGI